MAFELHDGEKLVFATNYDFRVATREDLVPGARFVVLDEEYWLRAAAHPNFVGNEVELTVAPYELFVVSVEEICIGVKSECNGGDGVIILNDVLYPHNLECNPLFGKQLLLLRLD